MKVTEKKILKLVIEYDNTKQSDERDEVSDYLDARFGRYNYHVKRMGPRYIGAEKVDMAVGEMVVEVDA